MASSKIGGDLTDRVAIVTGAGRGVGRAEALRLAAAGAAVVVNDAGVSPEGEGADASPAAAVVGEIEAAGGAAVASIDRVDDPDGAARIVETAIESFGRVDVVVNNAGILRDVSFAKMSLSDWTAVLDVHLLGSFLVTRAAWPHLKEQRFGRVIFTTSHSGLLGNFGQANYSAAKMGLVGLANSLAIEGARYDITVNVVAPLASSRLSVATPSLQETVGSWSPDHVAALVEALCSPAATDTGAIVMAGNGRFRRYWLAEGPEVRFDHVPSRHELLESWNDLMSGKGITRVRGLSLTEPDADAAAANGGH